MSVLAFFFCGCCFVLLCLVDLHITNLLQDPEIGVMYNHLENDIAPNNGIIPMGCHAHILE